MREIINLIRLDFTTALKKSVPALIIMTLIMCMVSLSFFPHMSCLYAIFAGLAVTPVFAVAEQNGYNRLYGTLPVKRRNIVIARFILALIVIAAATVISCAVGLLSAKLEIFRGLNDENFLNHYDAIIEVNITVPAFAAMAFLLGCVFTCYEVTLLFLFGVSREMVMSILFGFVSCGLLFVIFKIFDIDQDKIVNWLTPLLSDHRTAFIISCVAIGVAITAAFCMLSSYVWSKREL